MCVSKEEESVYILVQAGYYGDQILTAFYRYQDALDEMKKLSSQEVEDELYYSMSIRKIPIV